MKPKILKTAFLFTLLFTSLSTAAAAKPEIALTIDDLPFVGESRNFHLNMIIETLKTNEVKATGFIIAKEVSQDNWKMLQKFREAGLSLGNHTLSHKNLNKVNADTFIQEIETADKILMPVLSSPKFFRYPYMAMSNGAKKEKVLNYLQEKNYQIAPITIDSKDFTFNQLLMSVPEKERRTFLKSLKPCYLAFIWQQTLKAMENNRLARNPNKPQILLIHANLLNAYVLPDIINMYKENGFTFIRLEEALKTAVPPTKPAVKPAQPSTPEEEDINPSHFLAWD